MRFENNTPYRHLRQWLGLGLAGLILLPLTPATALAQKEKETASKPAFALTIDNIMRGPDLVGTTPTQVRWSRDSQKVYFSWKEPGEPREKDPDTFMVNRDGSNLQRLSEADARNAPPITADLSKDKAFSVFDRYGDLFLYNHTAGRAMQLTKTTEVESNPHFTTDQKSIFFTRNDNLFLLSLETGALQQLSNFRSRPGPDEKEKGTDSQEYLKQEEKALIEILRQRAKKREEREAKAKERLPLKPFTIPGNLSLQSLELSPDQKYILASFTEEASRSKIASVPFFVTESAYTEMVPTRNNVGDLQTRYKMAVVTLATGDVKFVEHSLKTTKKPKPEAGKEPAGEPQTIDREVYYGSVVWSDDGSKAALLLRAFDNKDQWVTTLDPAAAKINILHTIHDDAWVDGPGVSTLGWLPDNQHLYFEWERDGYAHLYTLPTAGGQPKQLTSGQFEVDNVQISEDKTRWYFTSNEVHPGEIHFYSMPLEGGTRTKLSTLPGSNLASVSPDGTMLALIRSYTNRPPEVYLQPNQVGAEAKQVTTSPTAEWLSFPWIDPPVVTFQARDRATVYARLYKPKTAVKGDPAVIFVHGAGYLQNAHKYWSYYYREFMFHHLLMEKGYTVLDVDYRASAGYGRDWRTGIYRHMGGKDLDDQVDAARWLVSAHGVDAKRIGLYGGSYGGFITLMALFTQPDVFVSGAALRPVTDWAHYNHEYTSNILNSPQDDPEAYRRSSPIYFAEGLKGNLLICHGMVDLNVHFQDSVRLAQRLIELRKENWELAVYPVEDHSFVESTSWADEYKRIFKLFEQTLKPVSKPVSR
ncbi:MAG TPA: prolyl oligopeptidase family serine peptidase [Acidobacteriota bacterium]|nr:prolyl oligopeptidase family serine peptidase [Acidobacteriota bacterium]